MSGSDRDQAEQAIRGEVDTVRVWWPNLEEIASSSCVELLISSCGLDQRNRSLNGSRLFWRSQRPFLAELLDTFDRPRAEELMPV